MKRYCPESCGWCGPDGYVVEEQGGNGEQQGEEAEPEDEEEDGDDEEEEEDVADGEQVDEDHPECEDREDMCTYWASIGECGANRYGEE
jgi:hypothetical protein